MRLGALRQAVFDVRAACQAEGAADASAREVGLCARLRHARGARHAGADPRDARGLTNGARGTVADIVARRDNSFPEVALVEMDEYEGPRPFPGHPRFVPAPAHTATSGESRPKRRTTVSAPPAWGVTIHKSQGQTYSGVAANMGRRGSVGLCYVALLRVRAFERLADAAVID